MLRFLPCFDANPANPPPIKAEGLEAYSSLIEQNNVYSAIEPTLKGSKELSPGQSEFQVKPGRTPPRVKIIRKENPEAMNVEKILLMPRDSWKDDGLS